MALQFDDKITWYLIALFVWVVGLLIWRWVDRSMSRYAMEAISEDEDAAAAAGVNVTAEKLKITLISALMTALAGALYCQYQMFISPDTVSGIAVSLQMVFAVIVGGLYVSLGPTVGAIITIMLAEVLRIGFGTKAVGWDNLVYGVLLVVFIIFLPKGILGSVLDQIEDATQALRDEMSKKSSQPLADELKPYVAPFRYDGAGEFHLKSHKTNEKGGLDKEKATKIIEANRERLNDFQEKLYAQDRWSLLLIFQGMDAAGKDSAIKSVFEGVNPQGCEVTSFKQPSTKELDHDFLWRSMIALPERGRIGIFNRSYYEECLVVRVHPEILAKQKIPPQLVTKDIWRDRFEDISAMERYLARNGTVILKFFLNVSREEQRERFLERLEEPAKNWKFSLADIGGAQAVGRNIRPPIRT